MGRDVAAFGTVLAALNGSSAVALCQPDWRGEDWLAMCCWLEARGFMGGRIDHGADWHPYDDGAECFVIWALGTTRP